MLRVAALSVISLGAPLDYGMAASESVYLFYVSGISLLLLMLGKRGSEDNGDRYEERKPLVGSLHAGVMVARLHEMEWHVPETAV